MRLPCGSPLPCKTLGTQFRYLPNLHKGIFPIMIMLPTLNPVYRIIDQHLWASTRELASGTPRTRGPATTLFYHGKNTSPVPRARQRLRAPGACHASTATQDEKQGKCADAGPVYGAESDGGVLEWDRNSVTAAGGRRNITDGKNDDMDNSTAKHCTGDSAWQTTARLGVEVRHLSHLYFLS